MSIIKHKDKRTGITYVYESESYWDKEKQQPRSHRKLIGKIDEQTGEVIPTGKSGRKKSEGKISGNSDAEPIAAHVEALAKKDDTIRRLKSEITALKKEKAGLLADLKKLIDRFAD